MTDLHDQAEDATVLTPEKREGLIPTHITLRRELNELEQQNILSTSVWALQRRHDPVSESFVRKLHRRMFRKVWRWAGTYIDALKAADNQDIGPLLAFARS